MLIGALTLIGFTLYAGVVLAVEVERVVVSLTSGSGSTLDMIKTIIYVLTELFICSNSQKCDKYIKSGSKSVMLSDREHSSLCRDNRFCTSSLKIVAAR